MEGLCSEDVEGCTGVCYHVTLPLFQRTMLMVGSRRMNWGKCFLKRKTRIREFSDVWRY